MVRVDQTFSVLVPILGSRLTLGALVDNACMMACAYLYLQHLAF